MNKTELVSVIAEKTGLTKDASKGALDAFIEAVTATLAEGEQVALPGFGTFKVSERAERQGRNPQTGETIQIAASKSARFTAGKALKEAVNV